jgi:hypothetical protein
MPPVSTERACRGNGLRAAGPRMRTPLTASARRLAIVPGLIERYVKLVRSVPLPLLIAIVWLKGFVLGWLVGRRR